MAARSAQHTTRLPCSQGESLGRTRPGDPAGRGGGVDALRGTVALALARADKPQYPPRIPYWSLDMRYRLLGHTGLFVSEICLGTMTYGGKGRWQPIGQLGLADVEAQVKAAFDAGVT